MLIMWRTVQMIVAMGCLAAAARAGEITFVAWSDQHVTLHGDASHLSPAVAAINSIEGKAYPASMGDAVAKPALVFGCGDCTDWPTPEATRAYAKATEALAFPHYDILGNHDVDPDAHAFRPEHWVKVAVSGCLATVAAYVLVRLINRPKTWTGRIASVALVGLLSGSVAACWIWLNLTGMERWIRGRHGGTSYSFDAGGVHFLAAHAPYRPERQVFAAESLAFIRRDLAAANGRPTIVASHYCLKAIANPDDVLEAFGDANVLMMMGGHHHGASHSAYKGRQFLQVPSPRYNHMSTVVRITDERLTAVPYDFVKSQWVESAMLDVPIPRKSPPTTR